MKFSTKNEVFIYLKEKYPDLIIEETFSGVVESILDTEVSVKIIDKNEDEYFGEMSKSLFPEDELNSNIIFLLTVGKNKGKEFIFINYFYWTDEQIKIAEEQAKELSILFENIPPSKLAN